MISVESVTTWAGLLGLEAEWNRLYEADEGRDYFLSFRWIRACIERYPLRWEVLTVRHGDTIVGLLPLSHRTRFSESKRRKISIIQTAGRLQSAQYAGLLCDPAFEGEALGALGQHLATMQFDRLNLEKFHQGGRLDALTSYFDRSEFSMKELSSRSNDDLVDNLVCPFIPLTGDFQGWLASLSRNRRKKLRRSLAMIDSGDVFRVESSTPDTALAHLEVVLDLWMKQWTGLRSESTLSTWRIRYWEILSNPASRGELSVPILMKNDIPVCGLGNLHDDDRGHFYCIVTGRDRAVEDQDIGNMIHIHCLREVWQRGYRTYDFCHGNEPYKYSFGSTDRSLKSLSIRRRDGRS